MIWRFYLPTIWLNKKMTQLIYSNHKFIFSNFALRITSETDCDYLKYLFGTHLLDVNNIYKAHNSGS